MKNESWARHVPEELRARDYRLARELYREIASRSCDTLNGWVPEKVVKEAWVSFLSTTYLAGDLTPEERRWFADLGHLNSVAYGKTARTLYDLALIDVDPEAGLVSVSLSPFLKDNVFARLAFMLERNRIGYRAAWAAIDRHQATLPPVDFRRLLRAAQTRLAAELKRTAPYKTGRQGSFSF